MSDLNWCGARIDLEEERKKEGEKLRMVDYKSSPQVLEHLEKSLSWTVFDTKWIPGTSSFVAVGAYAKGKRDQSFIYLFRGQEMSVNCSKREDRFLTSQPSSSYIFLFLLLACVPIGTGALHVYDLGEKELNTIHEKEVRPASIKCCTLGASSLRDPQVATGDFEGKLDIYDIETMKPTYSVKNAHGAIINCIDGIGGSMRGQSRSSVRYYFPYSSPPI